MSETGYVYTLNDPRTDEPKYVGATVNPENRLYTHKHGMTNDDVMEWIRELRAEGLEPEMVVVRTTELDSLPDAELEIIRRLSQEWELLNRNENATYPLGSGVEEAESTSAQFRTDIQSNGRCYIPKAAREKLGINGKPATVEIEVRYDE